MNWQVGRTGKRCNSWRGGLDRYVVNDDGCWVWTGATNGIGYGKLRVDGRIIYAHRAMYEREVGAIPEGLELDHLCRVALCINPGHLEPVTCRINLLRGEGVTAKNAAKTHCPQGHEYSPDNLYLVKNGSRLCRKCTLAAVKRYQEKKRGRK